MNLRGFLDSLLESPARDKTRVLALGGGGARGLAHMGVIHVLEEEGWRPDLITGTSMGSVIGGLYALTGEYGEMARRMGHFLTGEKLEEIGIERFQREHSRLSAAIREFSTAAKHLINALWQDEKGADDLSVLPARLLRGIIGQIFEDATFDDLKLPFVAVATDLLSGRDVELTSGSLAEAVTASSAIPGIFAPIKRDEMLLVDGGVIRNIPVPLEGPAEGELEVVAVDVNARLEEREPPDSPMDVIYRVDAITMHYLNMHYLERADLVIDPKVGNYDLADFRKHREIIALGRDAAREAFASWKSGA